jgi:DivIVA domain-containing protein
LPWRRVEGTLISVGDQLRGGVGELEVPAFSVGTRGYERAPVDALMERIEGTLGRQPLSGPTICSEEVRKARFKVVFRGYDRRAVDETLLDRIRELAAIERGPSYRPRHLGQGDGVGGQWLVEWIEKAAFKVVRMRPGYAIEDVDGFLDRVMAGLLAEAAPVSPRDVRECRFRSVALGSAYDEKDVDRFLDQLATALDGLGER